MKKIIALIIVLILIAGVNAKKAAGADLPVDQALNFLRAKQDTAGRITTGFSAPSQWSAIAFMVNGVDAGTVSNSGKSLKEFLLSDLPSEPSSATDWENRILAIVAIGEDPTNFGGVDFVKKLENFYSGGQIGDACSLNDDLFGLLALISAGNTSSSQIKQDILSFIIRNQDVSDGGFGYSAPGCAWYSTSADMTGAAIQALQAAKDNGLVDPGLDDALVKAENYLMNNQDADGGFGYYGSSDSDTTGWVIMALNALGLKDSDEAIKARSWLLTQQSSADGGFMAFDYGTNTFVSNATTTAQSVIALSGKSWLVKIFDPAKFTPLPTASPSATTTPTPTVTPTATPVSSVVSNPTSTPVPTATPLPPTPTANIQSSDLISISGSEDIAPTPTLAPQVLGERTSEKEFSGQVGENSNLMNLLKSAGLGLCGVFALFLFNILKKKVILGFFHS